MKLIYVGRCPSCQKYKAFLKVHGNENAAHRALHIPRIGHNEFQPAFLAQGREPRQQRALRRSGARTGDSFYSPGGANSSTAEHGRHYNLMRREWRPALSSSVLVQRQTLSNADKGFVGHYRVVEFLSSNIVRLQDTAVKLVFIILSPTIRTLTMITRTTMERPKVQT
ncbi:GD11932 [Drosophila simulans]|uniref:GD11932 n=1 Tax=Drosophila simulans TaxID=7240 RepID=B4NTK0_DROSI|nr:GD11932 [Drosophila simulans]